MTIGFYFNTDSGAAPGLMKGREQQMYTMIRDLVLAVLMLTLPQSLFSANWPQWRGPTADGVSEEKGFPLEWGLEQNILWISALPGLGTSTPIVWDDFVFV